MYSRKGALAILTEMTHPEPFEAINYRGKMM